MKFLFNNQEIEYEIKKSRRAKHLRLAVKSDAKVVVTLPWRADIRLAEKFMNAKAAWIAKHVAYFQKHASSAVSKITKADYQANKAQALKLVQEKVDYFNQIYKFPVASVSIKNQKTRWGSCSRRGNLNFNFRLIFLPAVMADYIIVHELCHLREMNHSPRFWALVAKTFPNHKQIRLDLKRAGLELM